MSFMGENDEFMMQMVMSEAKGKVQGRIQNIWLQQNQDGWVEGAMLSNAL